MTIASMRRSDLLLIAVILLASCRDVRKTPETGGSEPTGRPVEAGVRGEIQELANQLRSRRAKLQKRVVEPGALPNPSQSLAETYLALAAVQVEKARDYMSLEIPESEDLASSAVKAARQLLEVRDPTSPPRLVKHSSLFEHAYFADNDSSPQPYFIHVPSVASAQQPLPLVVFLHGWLPDTSRIDPWLVTDDVAEVAEKHGVFLVFPHGRTNTDFQYAGERDVLRVIAEISKFYSVDPDRIYLTGTSMGGAGVWQIGMHYPDMFAALAPINAQGDWFRFWHEVFQYPPRRELPNFIQNLFAAHNPQDLAENLSLLYSYSQHASLCFLGPAHTRDIVSRLRSLNAPYDFFEDPSELGHSSYLEPGCWERTFDHLLKQRRVKDPKRIRYVTSSLRFPGSYWLHINSFTKWCSPAVVEARARGNGRIQVTTKNVASLSLTPPASWSDGDGLFSVRWNSKSFPGLRPEPDGSVRVDWPAGRVDGKLILKNAAVCGPASDVFNFPFVVVQGTTGTSDDKKVSAELTSQFADAWHGYAEGRVQIVRDTEVTAEMIREKNLVLIGSPEANSVVMRIKDSLPFKISRDTIMLPGGKSFHGRHIGLALTYPNPLAPDRYVLIMKGILWGERRAQNHRFDLLPDFAVFGADAIPAININRFYAAGFFDENWRYQSALTDFWP